VISTNGRTVIAQSSNFQNDFGSVFRGSGIFYFKSNPNFKTTLSLLNYWKFKRQAEVGVLASIRDMNGKLLRREKLNFDEGMVFNYSPHFSSFDADSVEGSIEIEVFSSKDLFIPYSAFMAVYETSQSVSMLHSYARTYSRHEVEEARTISNGEESCWTLRNSEKVRSFGIIHNGGAVQAEQLATLRVRNQKGEIKEARFKIPELPRYGTYKIYPGEIIPGLNAFLNAGIANASLSFQLNESFTRMLVGNESLDAADFQITHSNFNYSLHLTDSVSSKGEDSRGYMWVPLVDSRRRDVIIYPDSDPGEYQVSGKSWEKAFKTGSIETFSFEPSLRELMTFKKMNGALPSRIVTGMVIENPNGLLPAECSLGVIHNQYRPRHTRWGLCVASEKLNSAILLSKHSLAYGEPPANSSIKIQLYSKQNQNPLEKTYRMEEIEKFDQGLSLDQIFPEAREFLGNDFGYYVINSEFGGLLVDSFIKNKNGCLTFEHAF
jgi:hypothetical protein